MASHLQSTTALVVFLTVLTGCASDPVATHDEARYKTSRTVEGTALDTPSSEQYAARLVALSAAQPLAARLQPATLSMAACTAQRLRKFVGPTGIHQPWPLIAELPPKFSNAFGELLSDQGIVADGYLHILHVDPSSQTAYIVQMGGFAGFRTVYGPLPVAACNVSGAP